MHSENDLNLNDLDFLGALDSAPYLKDDALANLLVGETVDHVGPERNLVPVDPDDDIVSEEHTIGRRVRHRPAASVR